MSGSFRTLVVAGHTLTFEVRVPAYDSFAPARYEAVHRTRLGACLVSRLATAAGVGADRVKFRRPPDEPAPVRDKSRAVVWHMEWTPGDKPDRPPQALRIGRATDVTYVNPADGFRPVVQTLFPPPDVVECGPHTAVYTYLDVCSPYREDVTALVPERAGFVLVHLSNTDTLVEPTDATVGDRARLCTFLDGVTRVRGRTTVLLVGDRVLHALGFPLTEDRSWEAFADECVRELAPGRNPKNPVVQRLREAFDRFDHVVVRHNPYAVVHLRPASAPGPRRGTLHYLVNAGQKFSSDTGYVRGINDILGASIAAAVMRGASTDEAIVEGIADGLDRSSRFDQQGYFHETEGFATDRLEMVVSADITAADKSDRWVTSVNIPAADADLRPAKWSVLDLHLRKERWEGVRGQDVGNPKASLRRALWLGLDIVRYGLARVQENGLRCPDTDQAKLKVAVRRRLPAVTFKKLKVVDRKAFEDVFEIRGAMLGYLNNFRSETSPLCLAMFGAPGGGKSFAVKQLAESLGHPNLELPALEVNVSQYDKPEELAWVFTKVRTATQGGKVPLVFFDEFDTTRDDRPFGWQQTFLAPMQDGKFGRPPDEIIFRHGIFVFVGGVNQSFDGITGRSRNRGFIEAKGPDFVSRLVRHLNVLGITQDDADADDFTFVIRRAVLLRDHLYRFQPKVFRDGEKGRAEVDDDVVSALLTVPRFRHGVRSLEAIVRTSRLHPDRPRLHWGALPPESQLDMHVDIAELQGARRDYTEKLGSGGT